MRPTIFCLLVLLTADAMADRVYIRDTLYVPLRGGQSTEHRILHRGLRSGTPLERLEINEDTGFSRVRTDDGLEGWLQTQYLVDEPIAATQLEGMQAKLAAIETEHQQTLANLRTLGDENEAMASQQADLASSRDSLEGELQRVTAMAADVIAINDENLQLTEDRKTLLDEIERLNKENTALLDDSAQEWFLRGAGTILLGLLFGVWIGRRIYQRRNNSGWS